MLSLKTQNLIKWFNFVQLKCWFLVDKRMFTNIQGWQLKVYFFSRSMYQSFMLDLIIKKVRLKKIEYHKEILSRSHLYYRLPNLCCLIILEANIKNKYACNTKTAAKRLTLINTILTYYIFFRFNYYIPGFMFCIFF